MTLLSVRLYNELCLLFLRRIVGIVGVLIMKRTSHSLIFLRPHTFFNIPIFFIYGKKCNVDDDRCFGPQCHCENAKQSFEDIAGTVAS